ncbi:CPC_1213 family protein [Clostridium oceanicum]|uniref:CPC_1213 family protein n=1 Tax=Clostridium oceanicum TaxID=1543 RepID=A0ABP3V4W6_9CLOT
MNEKWNRTHNDKKEDGNFKKKNIKHNPQAESARAKFGMNNEK